MTGRRTRVVSPRQVRRQVALTELTDEEEQLADQLEQLRPKTRADCERGERPCPFVSCRYNLYVDIGASGSIQLNYPDKELDEVPHTCALDVADEGGKTLEEVGDLLNVTRERVRQMEERSLRRMWAADSALAADD